MHGYSQTQLIRQIEFGLSSITSNEELDRRGPKECRRHRFQHSRSDKELVR
jgi:hypothetical protein